MNYQAITEPIRADLDSVERLILGNLGSHVPLIPRVGEYVFASGGKRFRPALLLLCARLAGYRGHRAHNLATVIEFVHTASLLHDDVVDSASLRRGREAANVVYGNQASVLVGDFLYGRASSMLADDGDIRAVKVVAEALRAMAEGEVMQLGCRHDLDTTEEEHIAVVERKTATLISASSELGAILGGCEGEEREALRAFGFLLGIAFQLMDDALDYVADERLLGKMTGNDLAEGKVTLPLIWALRACRPSERETINAVLKSERLDLDEFRAIAALIRQYGGIEGTMTRAQEYMAQGQRRLDLFPDGPEKDALLRLSEYVVARKR